MKSLRIFVFYILLFTFATLQSKANSIAAPDPYKSDVTYPTKSELDYPNFIDSVSPDQIAWNQIDSAGNWDTDLSAEVPEPATEDRLTPAQIYSRERYERENVRRRSRYYRRPSYRRRRRYGSRYGYSRYGRERRIRGRRDDFEDDFI